VGYKERTDTIVKLPTVVVSTLSWVWRGIAWHTEGGRELTMQYRRGSGHGYDSDIHVMPTVAPDEEIAGKRGSYRLYYRNSNKLWGSGCAAIFDIRVVSKRLGNASSHHIASPPIQLTRSSHLALASRTIQYIQQLRYVHFCAPLPEHLPCACIVLGQSRGKQAVYCDIVLTLASAALYFITRRDNASICGIHGLFFHE